MDNIAMGQQPFPTSDESIIATSPRELSQMPALKKSTSERAVTRHDHPYPIRTTSSSLLTRSNSIGSVHRPTVIPNAITPSSPALGRSQGRGHKKTQSQPSVPPLPLPPSTPASPDKHELEPLSSSPAMSPQMTPGKLRLRRSDTLSSAPSPPPASPFKLEDLPENPKAWTSSHLAAYLSSALRLKGGGSLPLPVIKDIATFIVAQKLSGRTFLRLTDRNLEDMGMNQPWRPAILNASRTLRQNVVQGRIWGFGNSVLEEEEEEIQRRSLRRTGSKHQSLPAFPEGFKLDLNCVPEPNAAETHSDAVSDAEADSWIKRGMMSLSRKRAGKVKGLVANFERSASTGSASSASENMADDEYLGPGHALLGSSDVSDECSSPNFDVQDDTESTSFGEVKVDPPLSPSGEAVEHPDGQQDEGDEQTAVGYRIQTLPKEPKDMDDPFVTKNAAENDPPSRHPDSSPVLPSPSIPPQTPPPSYTPSGHPEIDLTPGRGKDSPSPTIILTANTRRRKNPAYIAELSFDLPSAEARPEEEQTMSELIANIDPSGANAWLSKDGEQDTELGLHPTAKRLFESVRSISRKANRPSLKSFNPHTTPARASTRNDSSGAGGATNLLSLFEPLPPLPVQDRKPSKATSDVGISTDDELEVESEVETSLSLQASQREEMLENFRIRLEEVEKRLEDMELRDAEREAQMERERQDNSAAQSPPQTQSTETQTDDETDDLPEPPATASEASVVREVGHVGLLRHDRDPTSIDVDEDGWPDPPLGALPSYVFLVGLGVCSVVMRVVFKRVSGRVF